MENPARFASNYNIAANSRKPGPKAIREGSVGTLAAKAKKYLSPTRVIKFKVSLYRFNPTVRALALLGLFHSLAKKRILENGLDGTLLDHSTIVLIHKVS